MNLSAESGRLSGIIITQEIDYVPVGIMGKSHKLTCGVKSVSGE